MLRSAPNRILHVLLACAFWFGLQLCFPQVLQAADVPGTVEEVSWRCMDPDDPNGAPNLVLDHDICPAQVLTFNATALLNAPCRTLGSAHGQGSFSLLPVEGVQPSAP